MLERFLQAHPACAGPPIDEPPTPTQGGVREAAGGRSFSDGLYRTHTEESSRRLFGEIDRTFPGAPPHTAPYGYDWLGRQFCARANHPDATSLIFEPGTGEVLEVPVSFAAIHDKELVDYRNEALASDFYAAYLVARGQPPDSAQCVVYGIPLFLGGEDGVPSLELVDLDVYWHLTRQLILKIKGLPPGTPIGSVVGG